MTTSTCGREQQISRFPLAGGSSGAGSESTGWADFHLLGGRKKMAGPRGQSGVGILRLNASRVDQLFSFVRLTRHAADRFRLVAELGGATAAAALLCGQFVPPAGARVGVVVCGANTDPAKVVGP